jgi:hypothetical protein
MTGGFLQLVSYGAQDFYLTGNPQISFFKAVYRRYTNFSMDYYRINPENNIGLSETSTTTYKFKIERNGDLISNIFLVFKLPEIFSSNKTNFRWIKNLGSSAIEQVSIFIGGNLIDKNYGDWFFIWQELTLPVSKRLTYDRLIGNIFEMNDPELSPRFTSYPSKTKSDIIPSIQARTIRLPLIFWFNRNPSMALPLVSLQYYPVEIQVEFRPITDLYTVIDRFTGGTINAENGRNSFNLRIKPTKDNNLAYLNTNGLQNFVDDSTLITNLNGEIVSFNIDPHLEINYIFLDKEEMNKFAKSEHKYLIEQVTRKRFKDVLGTVTLDLKLHHPVSCLVVVPRRSDHEDRNDWNNFTNWITKGTPWNSFNEFFEPFFDDAQAKEIIGNSNYDIKGSENIIKSLSLKLNGVERFSDKDSDFYNLAQSYNYAKNTPSTGILFYSFSLDPFDYQPSGSCNMSRFNDIKLSIETTPTPIVTGQTKNLYDYVIDVYAINYNILSITGGQGNLEFSN